MKSQPTEKGVIQMPREIKFRGKSQYNGNWIYGSLVNENMIVQEIDHLYDDGFALGKWDLVDPETVGQYTGLKDSSGNEIYEGDIVEYEGMKGNVFFNEESLQFVFETNLGGYEFKNGQRYDEYPEYGTYKVIGNIYEHPELLER